MKTTPAFSLALISFGAFFLHKKIFINLKKTNNIFCIISTIILAFTFQKTFSQSTRFKAKVSIARIVTANNETVKGILYAVNDSMVALYTENTMASKDFLLRDSLRLKIYSYRDIFQITVRRRGAVVEAALIGGASGVASGLFIDEVIRDIRDVGNYIASPWIGNREDVGVIPVFTIIFGLIGMASGIFVGTSLTTFEINGNKINFNGWEKALTEHCLKEKF